MKDFMTFLEKEDWIKKQVERKQKKYEDFSKPYDVYEKLSEVTYILWSLVRSHEVPLKIMKPYEALWSLMKIYEFDEDLFLKLFLFYESLIKRLTD